MTLQSRDDGHLTELTPLYAAPAPLVPLTRTQINKASRDAQIAFCLKSGGTYEEEFARAVEAAHGITGTQGEKT